MLFLNNMEGRRTVLKLQNTALSYPSIELEDSASKCLVHGAEMILGNTSSSLPCILKSIVQVVFHILVNVKGMFLI